MASQVFLSMLLSSKSKAAFAPPLVALIGLKRGKLKASLYKKISA